MTRSLLFTTGSPFARGVRVILDEIGLDYERREEITTPSAEERARTTPTLQVPAFRDGDMVLWESGLIAEYLVETYGARQGGSPPLAAKAWRAGSAWEDKLVFATIQTFGTAVTTISQLTWTGVGVDGNAHLARSAEKLEHLLDWLEARLGGDGEGFQPGALSIHDIFLACHIGFLNARPLGVALDPGRTPRVTALVERLDGRESFRRNPVWWWEPGVTGYEADGTPIRGG